MPGVCTWRDPGPLPAAPLAGLPAVAGVRAGWLDAKVDVHTRGGVLSIEWAGALDPNGHVFMTGPAETAFEGEIEL